MRIEHQNVTTPSIHPCTENRHAVPGPESRYSHHAKIHPGYCRESHQSKYHHSTSSTTAHKLSRPGLRRSGALWSRLCTICSRCGSKAFLSATT
ncbi:hypothetical protein PCANC_23392 [Puccinia coronata f. sp. avenae]|uniref:Uncharacterized protein n=1 Tax=Puccinia coronata f. sp. avenae TaxID=200324 RepID=A0A2N5SGR2_9BASI|nr:hypothetical protein PCANC_23392 [Puccinia coronata f. sp. avenae]